MKKLITAVLVIVMAASMCMMSGCSYAEVSKAFNDWVNGLFGGNSEDTDGSGLYIPVDDIEIDEVDIEF